MDNIEDILQIDSKSQIKSYKKGDIIQYAQDTNALALYVKKGLLRSYIIDSKGKEHIYAFAPEGWVIGDLEAMQFNEPVQLFVDCLEDSKVIPFDKDSLFNSELSKERIMQNAQVLYRRIGRLQRRIIMQMSSPAIDRYQYFLEMYPRLPQRIPQHMIASFLGITPQALSTIRREQSNK